MASTATGPATGLLTRHWPQHPVIGRYALLSPALLLMLAGLLMPVLLLVGQSFVVESPEGWHAGLANYAAVLEGPQYQRVLARSIAVAALVATLTVLLAYPAAYFIAFEVSGNKMTWLILITLPFWTSYLLRVFAWKLILGFNGVINSALVYMGLIDAPLEFLLHNTFAVIVTLAHAWAAFAILPIFVSLQKIDRSLLEAAQDLGEGPAMTFLRVTLPLSMPGVISAFLLVFIPTVGDYVTPKLVGGPNGIMIGSLIQFSFGQLENWPLGSAIAVLAMLVVTALVCLFLWTASRARRLVA
ncbi:MAG: ABC transporter permease [Hyphomicrobiaceae bacterium]